MINIPRALKDKVYSMQKQMGNRIRKMYILRRKKEEMLEINSSVTEKKKKPYNYAYYFQIKEKHFVYKGIKIRIISNSTQKPSKTRREESEKVLNVERKQKTPIQNSIVREMIFKSKGKTNTSSDKQKLGKEYDKAV